MKRSRKRLCIIVTTILLFGGCTVKKVPPTNLYHLSQTTTQTEEISPSKPKFESLRVTFANSSRVGESTSIYYIDENFKKQPYSFSRWYDSVDSMFEAKLLLALKRSGIAESIASSESAADTKTVLEISILDFAQDFSSGKPSKGRVVVLASLIRSKDAKSMATGLFQESIPAKTEDAKGGVAALNTATEKIVNDIIEWLKEVKKSTD